MTIASPWSAELAQDWVLDEWQPARWAVPWEQLADAVGVTPMEVSRWERDQARPPDDEEGRLIELYRPAQLRLAVKAMGGEDLEIPEEGA